MRIFLHERASLALSGDISEGDMGGCPSRYEAWRILCDITGVDLGLEPSLWKDWFRENLRTREDLETIYSLYYELNRKRRIASSNRTEAQQKLEGSREGTLKAIFEEHERALEGK